METEVQGHMVPVRPGPRSIVTFTAGAKGPHEAGRYAFWFAVFDSATGRGHIGRGPADGDPGERFNRHPDDPAYAGVRADLKTCEFVMPAPAQAIEHWLAGHRKDAAFAVAAEVGGVKYRVREGRLIPDALS